ncbi:NADPH-dependent F420 reductase [Actinokineospora sp. G85]|uniref:NADPH-dependent F420 reductase n=1 Tax=Actinokineospora sp. G85 TaxID=3406626 RepID=UPI003C75C8C5
MKIGIIGAGNIGGALTRGLTKLGHEVRVANSRGPETLADLAAETGATAVRARDAAQDAEIVIITIPQKNIPDLPRDILDTAAPGAVFVDTGNYYPKQRDGLIPDIESGTAESRWVANHLGVEITKAFNGIAALHLQDNGSPKGTPNRIALPIAGDDPAAKQKLADLIDALGFDPVDAGTLDESWRLQPGTPGYGKDYPADQLKAALADASPERPEDFKA